MRDGTQGSSRPSAVPWRRVAISMATWWPSSRGLASRRRGWSRSLVRRLGSALPPAPPAATRKGAPGTTSCGDVP
eukprot:133734-Alexandrium_andersonii.AAC.1